MFADMTLFERSSSRSVVSTVSFSFTGSIGYKGYEKAIYKITVNVLHGFAEGNLATPLILLINSIF